MTIIEFCIVSVENQVLYFKKRSQMIFCYVETAFHGNHLKSILVSKLQQHTKYDFKSLVINFSNFQGYFISL